MQRKVDGYRNARNQLETLNRPAEAGNAGENLPGWIGGCPAQTVVDFQQEDTGGTVRNAAVENQLHRLREGESDATNQFRTLRPRQRAGEAFGQEQLGGRDDDRGERIDGAQFGPAGGLQSKSIVQSIPLRLTRR